MADSLAKGVVRSSDSKSELGRADRADSVGLLQTLETSLDDIRSLITCRVCIRPLFEPYTIECGHTFCYGCLVRWFERDQAKKSCPDCRADALRPPAPAYLVRDMTQIFANRAELMPVGETTQEHKRWQEEEAALVERDRATTGPKGGLFRGCFRLTRPIRRRSPPVAIRDEEDGVVRCPVCTWELEDGHCESCGYPEEEVLSDSDGHGNWDSDMDGATMEEIMGVLGEDARMNDRIPDHDYFSEHGYSSEDGSSEETAPRTRHRDIQIAAQLHGARVHPLEERHPDSFLDDTDEDSEVEEAGSLDGFVVNDVDDRPHSITSSTRSFHWETDEGPDGEGNHMRDSNIDQNSQGEDGFNESSVAMTEYDSDDESDEGPILRSRRQVRSTSLASNQFSSSDGTGGSGVSQALNALHVRNRFNGSRVSMNAQRTISHRNPDASGERSTGGLIEIDSDSDSPVPAQRTRRRRGVPNRLSSDDDSDVEASSGTATVGRDSPRPIAGWINRRNGSALPASRTSNASSPILIESSPMRSPDRQLAVPGAFPHTSLNTNISQPAGRVPTRADRRGENYSQDTSTRRSPASASQSNRQQQRRRTRLRSPHPPRAHAHGPASRPSHSPTPMELFEQGRRNRQAKKIERRAERQRLKADREQRGRHRGLSLSPGSSNQS